VFGGLFSLVLCPLASISLAAFAVVRRALRQSWDTVMFHLLIKKRARVPFTDTFVARRVAGPGMASNYFYQIKTEQALVALEATMESDELRAFQDEMSEIISSPLEDYKNFISSSFKPLGVSVNKQIPGPYKDLEEETTSLLDSLNKKVGNRWAQLSLPLPECTRSRIKLTDRELRLALSRGAAMAQGFYPEHVIGRADPGQQHFWQKRQLRENDWVGLVSSLYSSIFSPEFLVPMQQTDTAFHLKAEHWNLTRYLNMVLEDDWHDDLDVARAVHTPRGNINIQTPYIDRALFNPLQDSAGCRHSKITLSSWSTILRKTYVEPRLCVPLPVPHPAIISMHIYNRDSDNPIRIEDCRSVLRDIREYPQPMSMEYLVGVKEVEAEEESAHSQHSRDSIYEMGPEMDSLTHSLEQLDTQVSLVKGTPRSNSVVESTLIPPKTNFHIRHEKGAKLRKEPVMSSQPTNYTRSQASLYNSPVLQRRVTRSQGSIGSARIASAEDVRIDNRDSIIDYHTAV